MHDEIAHMRVVDGALGSAAPGLGGFLVVWINADNVEFFGVFERDAIKLRELAAEHQMKKLLRHEKPFSFFWTCSRSITLGRMLGNAVDLPSVPVAIRYMCRLGWSADNVLKETGMKKALLGAVAAAVLGTMSMGTVDAQDFQPAIIYDLGGKFDKSFNEAAYNGAERFKEESGVDYVEFEVTNESQRDQALRRMARRGATIVVAVGFSYATPLETIAEEFPDTKFTIIDSVVEKDNVQSVVFKEHEGSFLVGMAAALTSETGKVGFVGGMDIPLIRNFAHGYEQGVKHVNGDAEVFVNMTGTTPAAWNGLERSGQGCGACAKPVRPRRRCGLCRCRRHWPWRPADRG